MKNSWHGCHDRVALFYELFGWGSIGDLNGNVGTTLGIWDHRGTHQRKKAATKIHLGDLNIHYIVYLLYRFSQKEVSKQI